MFSLLAEDVAGARASDGPASYGPVERRHPRAESSGAPRPLGVREHHDGAVARGGEAGEAPESPGAAVVADRRGLLARRHDQPSEADAHPAVDAVRRLLRERERGAGRIRSRGRGRRSRKRDMSAAFERMLPAAGMRSSIGGRALAAARVALDRRARRRSASSRACRAAPGRAREAAPRTASRRPRRARRRAGRSRCSSSGAGRPGRVGGPWRAGARRSGGVHVAPGVAVADPEREQELAAGERPRGVGKRAPVRGQLEQRRLALPP